MKYIGISCGHKIFSGKPKQFALNADYVEAVLKSGAVPVIIAPSNNNAYIKSIIERLDGFILSGGGDIDPSLIKQKKIPQVKNTDRKRDLFEIRLAGLALKNEKPVLGICKGVQIMNAALGGSLLPDIIRNKRNSINHKNGYHKIEISPNSKLHDIFRKNKIIVNSSHHQAVNVVGKGLKAAAFSGGGIIEAIEFCGKNFFIGVQFHPERLLKNNPVFLKLFKYFIKHC